MHFIDKGIEDVPSIQLPYWQKVDGCREQSSPCSLCKRMQGDVVRGHSGIFDRLKDAYQKRRAEDEVPARSNVRYDAGIVDANDKKRKQCYKPGDGTRYPNIEEATSSVDREI